MVLYGNWKKFSEELEKLELQAQGGVSSPLVYSKLLAFYLYQNDLNNAKYLWKRIPTSVKSQSAELCNVWNVGKALWKKDFPSLMSTLNVCEWSDNISKVMNGIKDQVQEKNLKLISNAYSNLSPERMAQLLGTTPIEAVSIAKEKGWGIEQNMITPKPYTQMSQPVTTSEEQLQKLTNFVSFLEN